MRSWRPVTGNARAAAAARDRAARAALEASPGGMRVPGWTARLEAKPAYDGEPEPLSREEMDAVLADAPPIELPPAARRRAAAGPSPVELPDDPDQMMPGPAHCRRGHLRTVGNTYVYRGSATCKTCRREDVRKSQARKRVGPR